jgi:hypothetical protein
MTPPLSCVPPGQSRSASSSRWQRRFHPHGHPVGNLLTRTAGGGGEAAGRRVGRLDYVKKI